MIDISTILEMDFDLGHDKKVTVNGALGYGPNYTFTGATKTVAGVEVYQIVAIDEFYTIKPGTIGGWVSSEDCLDQSDRCWICSNVVLIDSKVRGNSYIDGNTTISKSIIMNSKINEGDDGCSSYVSSIKSSNINASVLVGEMQIHKSAISDTKYNEIDYDCNSLDVISSNLKNVAGMADIVTIRNSSISNMELLCSGEIVGIEVEGMVQHTQRPVFELVHSEEFPSDVKEMKYDGYLPIGVYGLEDIRKLFIDRGGVKSVKYENTAVREDIEEFLNSLK